MKTEIDHLPESKQVELAKVRSVLLEELEERLSASGSPGRRRGRILKIILYGSYARGGWQDDPKGGFFSDYDLLVLVNNKELTDETKYWSVAKQRLMEGAGIKTPVSLTFYTLTDFNKHLRDARTFYVDIYREGILLYELHEQSNSGSAKHQLAEPGDPDPPRVFQLAFENSAAFNAKARIKLNMAKEALTRCGGEAPSMDEHWLDEAAFNLHQAAEFAYLQYLIVRTAERPKDHHLGRLRNRAESYDDAFLSIWPRHERRLRGYFDILNRAYVNARYSIRYGANPEIIDWQMREVERLIETSMRLCEDWLAHLKAAAEASE